MSRNWLAQVGKVGGAAVLSLFFLAGQAQAKKIYVNVGAATSGDGTTWPLAIKYLQDALLVAKTGDEIYLAQGTYYPDDGGGADVVIGDRELSFNLNGITLYGGYLGTGATPDTRNITGTPSILSGAIWDITPSTLGYERYWSLHVIIASNNPTLDGVTVKNGRANGNENPANQGGGVYVSSGLVNIVDCTFDSNLAAEAGGAIFGTVQANRSTFNANMVNNEYLYAPSSPKQKHWLYSPDCTGGAIEGNVTATKCVFTANTILTSNLDTGGNTSGTGGAISGATITLHGCSFTTNSINSSIQGGGPGAETRGAAVSGTTIIAENCTFATNTANSNGGDTSGGGVAGKATLSNCIFQANTATGLDCAGAGLYLEGASSVTNCVFTGNLLNGTAANSRGGSGLYAAGNSTLPLTNNTFFNNNVKGVGAAFASDGSVSMINNIFWTDAAAPPAGYTKNNLIFVGGKGRISNRLYPTPSTETINIVKGGYAAVASDAGADVDFGEPPERTLPSTDPLFVNSADPDGVDNLWHTTDDGLRIQAASPAIGFGKAAFLPADTFDLDADGNLVEKTPIDNGNFARIQGGTLDLGAYEFGNALPVPDIKVEDVAAVDLTDGVSAVSLSDYTGVNYTFTIRNPGFNDLKNLVVTIDGANAADFQFTQPLVTTVAPNGSTTFTVKFKPTVATPRTAALHIASNDPDENPFDITLNGTAKWPEIAIEQPAGTNLTDDVSSIDFAPATLVGSFRAKTFKVTNSGTGNLIISSIVASGTNAAYFIPGNPASSTVAPGGSNTFMVRFEPQAIGTFTGFITVNSNDPDAESAFRIKVNGKGYAEGEILVSQPTGPEIVNGGILNYGTVPQGTLYGKTIVIKNTGLGNLNSITVSLTGNSNFSKTAYSTTTLYPGKSAQFVVNFKPTSTGAKVATLKITSNDSDESVISVTLNGTGGPPQAAPMLAASAAASPSSSDGSSISSSTTTVTGADGSKYLLLTIDKPANWDPAAHVIEVSPNLTDWYSGSKYTTTLTDNASILSVRDNTPVQQGVKRYIRLK